MCLSFTFTGWTLTKQSISKPERVAEVQRVCTQGDWSPSQSFYHYPPASAWSFSVVIFLKKDIRARFCVDQRELDRFTKAERWTLPRMEEVIDKLGGCLIFNTVDLFCRYWQDKMLDEFKEMTTFVCRYGTFMFQFMPFGLMNAPSTFQRMMDHVQREHLFVLFYTGDVALFSRSLKKHVTYLKAVIVRIAKHRLKLRLFKCFFAVLEVSLLGNLINCME